MGKKGPEKRTTSAIKNDDKLLREIGEGKKGHTDKLGIALEQLREKIINGDYDHPSDGS